MRPRLRNPSSNRQDGPLGPRAVDEDATAEPLNEARERGRELLDAAERALSGDSRRFLRASRQQGGQ